MDQNRREFFKRSVAAGAFATVPYVFANAKEKAIPKEDGKPTVAAIGVGGSRGAFSQGGAIAKRAGELGRMIAVCDVDAVHCAEFNSKYDNKLAMYGDYRRMLEREQPHVVTIGTPDHWHVPIAIAAMHAGCDVYCEKPLTLTIDEGKHLVETVRKEKRILQTGTQQRSEARFRLACELVRNGRIGKLIEARVFVPAGLRAGPFGQKPVPPQLNWDSWQGHTPSVPFVEARCHRTFRYWWEYSGGTLTDWGAHHNDVVLWAVGPEPCGPVEVEAKPRIQMIPGGFTASSEYEVRYTYANGVQHICETTTASGWNGAVLDPNGQQHGIRFTGTDGWIWVTRGDIKASDRELLTTPLPADAVRLYVSNQQMGNFLECVRERKEPICNVETGHRSASLCHLGAISMRLGRKLRWDPGQEDFVGDKEASGMRAREMRKPWDYDCLG